MAASPLVSILVFLVGIGVVVWSVEEFVEHVAEAAVGLGVSTFLLTVALAGTDLENAVLGVAAAAGDLPDVAVGTVFGEALFILGAAVGIAGVVAPFEESTPREYLALTAVSPALLFVLGADGRLSRTDGVLLLVAFVPLVWAIYRWEAERTTRYLDAEDVREVREKATEDEGQGEDGEADEDEAAGKDGAGEDEAVGKDGAGEETDEDDERGLVELGVVLLTVVGMTAGSELAVMGARDILDAFGLVGLAFGATVMSFVASLEEILLTVEPVREGRPEVGIGNVVGSTLFFVTANAGIIAMVHPLGLSNAVFAVHWPFFLVALALVMAFLLRGKVGRPEGGLLLAVYAAYWVSNYAL
ncbi:sodium:calcium antiporter [Halorussus salinisoli]|uniref:sodium:calcium antiporter n=1 Tax=Halorussus salinisoli TaxID=2558242 RepID=UPI0010C1D414|nr:sodium:calcium antiporter [Halorussus salinisoli]